MIRSRNHIHWTGWRKFMFIFFPLLYGMHHAPAQTDSNALISLAGRVVDFDEKKADSVLLAAEYIEKKSAEIGYATGRIMGLRLRGIYAELKEDFPAAVDHYLKAAEEARKQNNYRYHYSSLTDLAITYASLGKPLKAKTYYLEAIDIQMKNNINADITNSYTNLGIIYRRLNQFDSALYYYNKVLDQARKNNQTEDIEALLNNIAVLYFYQKKFPQALKLYRQNYQLQLKNKSTSGLYFCCLNLAEVFIEMKQGDSARHYLDYGLELARELGSKKKEAGIYWASAKYYAGQGNYKLAYEYQSRQIALDTAVQNEITLRNIDSLQQSFNLRSREQDNKLLAAQLDKQHLQKRNLIILAIAAFSVALLSMIAFMIKRKANRRLTNINDFVHQQNEKLTELNQEKNTLIGIVSHDLGAPFANIKLWNQILISNAGAYNEEQLKAIERIRRSTLHGEQLIQHILDVERSNSIQHKLSLQRLNVTALLTEITEGFQAQAQSKDIRLSFTHPGPLTILTDTQAITRIGENLISNAIKFTPEGKSVQVSLKEEDSRIVIRVKDEGPGISADEIPLLFSRYGQLSSRPTGGEKSTGLGLFIVKRLVQELNGKISYENADGKGAEFIVVIPV